MVWRARERPAWVERLNSLGENLGCDGRSLVSLDPEEVIGAAVRTTGLDDFGDDWFREPYRVLMRSLETEAKLTLLGRLLARSEVQRTLQNRLRIEDAHRKRPRLAESPVDKPIFVTGLGRSGTTFLHELLTQDTANRVPMLWELLYSVPPPERGTYATDPRIGRADREITLMDSIAPELRTMHVNAGDLPTECIFIFALQLVSDMFIGTYDVPTYALWGWKRDLTPIYEYHRRVLQLLQSKHAGARWVLKAPSHFSHLEELFAVYPDARVIVTHRDPLRVLGSVASLMATLRSMRSDHVDPTGIVHSMAFGFAHLLERYRAERADTSAHDDRIADVRYGDLVADPIGTVGRVYERWSLSMSREAARRLEDRVRARRTDSQPAHEYSFADTGLDLSEERPKYEAYQEFFRIPSEV